MIGQELKIAASTIFVNIQKFYYKYLSIAKIFILQPFYYLAKYLSNTYSHVTNIIYRTEILILTMACSSFIMSTHNLFKHIRHNHTQDKLIFIKITDKCLDKTHVHYF